MFNSKEYCRKNAEKAKARSRKWYRDHHAERLAADKIKRSSPVYKEKMKIYLRDYYAKNKSKVLAQHRAYRSRPGYLEWKKSVHLRLMNSNPNYKLGYILRGRVQAAIKFRRGKKAYKTLALLGCTIDEARQHIEKQFREGMSWENHGMFTWHIDHIIPLTKFDLTKPEEQKKAFHFTNLQPLFAQENLSKNRFGNTMMI